MSVGSRQCQSVVHCVPGSLVECSGISLTMFLLVPLYVRRCTFIYILLLVLLEGSLAFPLEVALGIPMILLLVGGGSFFGSFVFCRFITLLLRSLCLSFLF